VLRLAAEKRVRPHPSKTVGDYWRELRMTADPTAPTYRAFAATYESVVYGDGLCDADRFAKLRALAEPLISVRDNEPVIRAA
jgi:hypothetical protein